MPSAPRPNRIVIPVPPERVVTDPAKLRWGTVSTIRAPLRDIARFAAWNLDLGAAEIHIFLDEPNQEVADFFTPFPQIKITQCTEDYWRKKPQKARSSHQLRQAYNATLCYKNCQLDWLAHIDVDEYLLTPRPVARMLAQVPANAAYACLRPAEMLAQPDPWVGATHFKLTRKEFGLRRAVLPLIYPEFGAYVPEGFISYTSGKNIARTGLRDVRLGIHALRHKGAIAENGHVLSGAHIGHAHAPNWETFIRYFEFRRKHGSYRKNSNTNIKLQDVLDLVLAEQGNGGLRQFFDEMCEASPELLRRLANHGMLLTATLDLDAKVARWFGELPNQERPAQ